MSEFDKLSEYIDRASLEKDTEFFISQLKRIETEASTTAGKVSGSFSNLFGKQSSSSTTKAIVDDMKQLHLSTANYRKILEGVIPEIDNLTKAQKKQLEALTEAYKAEEKVRQGAKESVSLIQTEIAQEVKKGALMEDLAATIAKNRAEIAARNRELKLSANVENAERNSLERAQALILLYTNEKKKLNLATEEGRRLNENYNKAIEKTNAFILKNADAETRRLKNVGNYSKSAQIIVEALEKEKQKLEELEKTRLRVQNAGAQFMPPPAAQTNRPVIEGFAKGNASSFSIVPQTKEQIAELKKLDAQIEQSRTVVEGFTRVTSQPKFLNIAGKVGDANAELKAFTKQLIELERSGLGSSDAAVTLRKQLAELTDQIGDAKAEIKALSSDTRGFDLFAGSVTFAADAMQVAAGAAAVFGASEEETAEAIKSVVAIQSISNGVKGIANELTTRGTAANKLYAFSQATLATAFNSSATAAQRFKAALITTGFGAIVVGIGLLISNFDKLKRAFTRITKEQEIFNETQAQYAEGAKEAVTQVSKVSRAFEDARNGVISKEQALNIYNETLGDSLGKTDDLATAEKNLLDKADAYIEITALKAQANALFAQSAEFTTKALTAELEDQTSLLDKGLAWFKGAFMGDYGEAFKELGETQSKNAAKVAADYQKAADLINNKAKELLGKAANLGKANGIIDPEAGKFEEEQRKKREAEAKKEADRRKKELEDRLKAELDAAKKRDEALRALALTNANERIRQAQKIVDDENATYLDQVAAIQNIENEKKLIAASNYAKAIEDERIVEDGKIKIVKKSNEEKALALREYEIQVQQLQDESFQAQIKANQDYTKRYEKELEKRRDAEREQLETANEQKLRTIERSENVELTALNKQFLRGQLSREEYEKKQLEITEKYAKQRLLTEIEYQKDIIKASTLTEEEKEDALTKLLELEKQITDASVKNFKTSEEKKREELEKTLNVYQEISSEVFGFVGGLLDASAAREKNRLQEQRDQIEENAAAEIAAIEASTASAEEKAAKIAIVNAKAAAERERIARKERQAEIDKAKFDKSVAIFNIIITNALNVVKAIGNPLKMAAAIAIGAAQLALALAQPIPKFKDGLHSDYEGMGIVGDGGKPEAIIRKNGRVEITPSTDTLTWLNKGDRIHPDANEFVESLHGSAIKSVALKDVKTEKDYTKYIIDALKDNATKITQAINDKVETHFDVKDGALLTVMKYGARQVSYFNQNTNW